MKIIGRPRLLEWMRLHSETKSSLQAWLREVEVASWNSVEEIRGHYHFVQILSNETVVFVLDDNRCQLRAHLNFTAGALLIVKVTACVGGILPLRGDKAGDSRAMLEGGIHDH